MHACMTSSLRHDENFKASSLIALWLLAGEDVEKVARKVSQAYIQTLAWSLVYYSHGSLPVVRDGSGDAAQIGATSGSSFPCGAPWDWCHATLSRLMRVLMSHGRRCTASESFVRVLVPCRHRPCGDSAALHSYKAGAIRSPFRFRRQPDLLLAGIHSSHASL